MGRRREVFLENPEMVAIELGDTIEFECKPRKIWIWVVNELKMSRTMPRSLF